MNRVTVVIENVSGNHRAEVSAHQERDLEFEQVLAVFEDALRGAGYYCPQGSLVIEDEPEPA